MVANWRKLYSLVLQLFEGFRNLTSLTRNHGGLTALLGGSLKVGVNHPV
jgi:hypothetical protein